MQFLAFSGQSLMNKHATNFIGIACFVFLTCLGSFSQAGVLRLIDNSDKRAVASGDTIELSEEFQRATIRARPVNTSQQFHEPDSIQTGDIVLLNLFSDVVITATVDRVSMNIDNVYTVRGRLEGSEHGYALISTSEGKSHVFVHVPEHNRKYRIAYAPLADAHLLREIDLLLIEQPIHAPPLTPPSLGAHETTLRRSASAQIMALPSDPAIIDVMIVYTAEALKWARQNSSGINWIMAQGMEMAQFSLANSGTMASLNLVHSALIDYTESGSTSIDLQRLTYTEGHTGDPRGDMDVVHSWRNTYHADLVVLLTASGDSGGRAWELNTTAGLPDNGFSVTRIQYADSFTFIHEIGHNLGAGHHKLQNHQPGPGLFNYSAGWRWTGSDGNRYCSVMSYEAGTYYSDRQTHRMVARFSNPSIYYQGRATGHPTDGDNARTIRETKHAVAAYRIPPTRIIRLAGILNFGSVMVGQTATQTLTIHNDGNTALSVAGISYPAGFTGNWNGTIAAGASWNVTVTFSPTTAQNYGGAVTVNSDRTSGNNTTICSGSGLMPTRIIRLEGDLLFSNVTVDQTATRTLTIHNDGNSTLTVNSISYPEEFSGNWSGTISAGGSRNVTVTFSPTDGQQYGGIVTVSSDRTSGNNTTTCLGIGAVRIINLTGDLSFGNVTVGQTVTRTLTIHNDGNSTLTISSISYPEGFSGNWNGTIAAGESLNVTVAFSPTAAQNYGGNITVNSDSTSGTNTRACSGTGVSTPTRIIRLSGDLAFGNIATGDTVARTLVIHNDGNIALTISGIIYPAGFDGNWIGTVAAGEFHSVLVTFSPSTLQTYDGNISVESDQTSGISTHACSGTGVIPTRIIRLTGDLAFGNVAVKGQTKSLLSIHNDGNITLTVSGFDYPIGFSGDWAGGTISAGGHHNMYVTFSPTDRLIYGGNITVESDNTDGIGTKECSGRGILVSDILTFHRISSTARSVSVGFEGFHGNEYLVESCDDLDLGRWSLYTAVSVANGQHLFTITIDPHVKSRYYRALAPTPDVHGAMRITPDLCFGELVVGDSATNSFYIENIGSGPLTISNIVFPDGFSGVWDTEPIQAGEKREVIVMFAPLLEQDYSGSIHVISDKYAGTASIACSGARGGGALYLVIDLSDGPSASSYPVSYMSSPPDDGWTDEYKTTKLVMRRIPFGTFIMGSPDGEIGHWSGEAQHHVTFRHEFYIGVFPVTQRQWERVMGTWPSHFDNTDYRDTRPVERVSYNMIRGSDAGSGWPADNNVDADSFMGRLRARTGQVFDLPNESQWEYACRAGTTTALNSGKNLTANDECPNMSEVGRYHYNHPGGYSSSSSVSTDGGTAKVGSYLENAWGLYDMHGNGREWCLDWYGTYPGTVTDPKGPSIGTARVSRSGNFGGYAVLSRAASRYNSHAHNASYDQGLRIALLIDSRSIIQLSGNMEFGEVIENAVATRVLTIENIGEAPLMVTDIQYPASFSVDWDGGVLLKGDSQSVTVTFSPAATMEYAGTITVISDSDDGDNTIAVSGTGIEGAAGMALVPAGDFVKTDHPDGGSWATTYISALYMSRTLITKAQWDAVHQWATNNGYAFDNEGLGKGADHPVHTISWYDMVKWCNARSEMEGFTPAYYTDGSHIYVYRTGQSDLSNACVKWTVRGYRLPTAAEWEKAARGGLYAHRFPWGNEISHAQANFLNNGSESYQYGTTLYHLNYNDGITPYTSPVGSFAPNGYGLYDMAGNVYEWCWDWTAASGYYVDGADPRGPDTGTVRMRRGGSWSGTAGSCRFALRNGDGPGSVSHARGFRVVLPQGE